MADWVSEIEAALGNLTTGPAGHAQQSAREAAAALALEAAHGKVTSHLLAQGIELTTLLARCALAEVEGDSAGSGYRQELAAAAETLISEWQLLLAACRQAGVPAAQIVGEGRVAYMTRSVIHLAQEVLSQNGLPPR